MTKSNHSITLKGRGTPRILSSIVMQSPLSGVSDRIFRKLIRRWAPDALLFTEMVHATNIDWAKNQREMLDLKKESGPIGVQLFDKRPQAMVEAAKRAEEEGAFLIDINMGCPVRKVALKGSGSGLLKNPELAEEIVNSVVNAVQIPVTVKTRLGWSENLSDPIGFSKRIEAAGAQLITLHGRTREQAFKGRSDWEQIALVKKALDIPVIANGDINNPDAALKCLKVTGADGVMIGRASMGAPWLVGQIHAAVHGDPIIKTPEPIIKLRILKDHLNELLISYGEHGLFIARKHIKWTYKDLPDFKGFLELLLKATTSKEAIDLLDKNINLIQSKY